MKYKKPILQILSLILIVLLVEACGTSQPIPTPEPPTPTSVPPTVSPTEIPRLSPSPRGYISMAYDAESKRVILFGGQTGDYHLSSSYNGETWAYDVTANKWTQMKPPSGPTGRAAADLVYDAESDRVILFGGGDRATWGLTDTWAYDYNTNTWVEMAKGPEKHLGARLAYDAESDKIILFGGYDTSNSSDSYYNDTWAYDFNSNTWTEMKPTTSPPGRNYQAMTYDAKVDRVLMWGCLDIDRWKPVDESIWSYDFNTNTWQEIKPGELWPSGRDYPAMAYDAKSDRTILYGGSKGGDETWAYDYNTNTWAKLEPSMVPGDLSRHAIVYSTADDRVILFGGQVGFTDEFNYTDKVWSYDFNTNTWTDVTPLP